MTRQNEPPDPSGSPNEKIEIPQKAWSDATAHEWVQYLLSEGIDTDLAQRLSKSFSTAAGMKTQAAYENQRVLEHWANVHTHPGGGFAGGGRGIAKYVFAGTNAPSVIAMKARNGNTFWTYTNLGGNVFGIAADDHRNTYIGAIDDTLHKVDEDGNQVWKVTLPARPYSVAVERDGSFAYVGFNDNSVRKYDGLDGAEIWSYTGHTDRVTGLAVGPGRYVHTASDDSTVHKVTHKGVWVWEITLEDPQSDVAVDLDGNTFSVSNTEGSGVHKIDPEGTRLWTAAPDGAYLESVAVDEDGNSFTPGSLNDVIKLDPEGNILWTSEDLGAQIEALVADEGSVYAGLHTNGSVAKLESDGTTAWHKTISPDVLAMAWSP